jgi:transcriptional regulator with XRE-family HTH domain
MMTMRHEGISEEVFEAIEDGVPPVRAFRVETEITIGELAEDTGIPMVRLDAIEEGATPKDEELKAISEALHVAPEILAEAIAA